MRRKLRALALTLALIGAFATTRAVSLTETHTNATCFAGTTGSINVTVNGGTAPFSFAWSDGPTTEDRTNLGAGTYGVTVTDFGGATAALSVSITQGASINTSFAITHVSCGGGNTGAVDLSVTGGVAGYTYLWGDGTTSQDRTNLIAALYYVTVTDAIGCQKIDSANVTQPAGMVLTKTTTNVTCGSGSNGAINLTVQFGTPGYTYHWNDNATTEDRTGIAAGTWNVTVTDATGCTASTSATVNQSGSGMSINKTLTNPTCNGAANGSINVTTVIGSVGPYTFNWSNGATTQNATGLSAGTYTVTATSTTGCTASATATLTQPTAISVNLNVISVTCYNGSNGAINTTTTGGTSPYSYNWGSGVVTQNRTGLSAGNYNVTVTDFKGCTATATAYVPQPLDLVATAVPSQLACTGGPSGSVFTAVNGGNGPYTYNWGGGVVTQDRVNIPSGNYSVTVTDANGCTAVAAATITAYTPMTLNSTQVNNLCFGGSTGSVDLTPTNGWTPYSYAWSNGPTTQDVNTLASGNYTVTVTDNHNCTVTKTVTITQPAFGVTINATVTDVNCFNGTDGAISLSVTNGATPYTYNWGSGITSQNRTNLAAGAYNVTVTDNNGCTANSSYTITAPLAISLNTTATNISCNGGNTGAISLTVSGGYAPYTYNWGGGITTQNRSNLVAGTYSVTVTDTRSCSASTSVTVTQMPAVSVTVTPSNVACNGGTNGAITTTVSGGTSPYSFNWGGGVTTQNRTNLSAGSYTVSVSDNLGCTASGNATITEPAAISASSTVTNVACAGGNTGAINLNVSGGTSPYSFNWGGGVTTQNPTNLATGSYTVTITDNSSCTLTHTATISQATTLTVSTSNTNVSCNGGNNGAISVTATGGTSPYTYAWNVGGNTNSKSGLTAGNYIVTVTDNAGCSIASNQTITEPAAIAVTPTVTNVACAGGNTGAISLGVTGGTSPYTFNWGGGVTTQNRTNLVAATYNVTVTDNALCSASSSATVAQNASLVVSTTVTNVSCNGANNGVISVTATGGTTPYTFVWAGGGNAQVRTNTPAGTYTVTVNDNAGCNGTATATITEPAALTVSATATPVICNGGSTGNISLTVSGGTGAYTFNWGGGITTQNRTNIAAGTYNVTVTDAASCTATTSATITQPAALSLSTTKTDVLCKSAATGAVTLTVTGGNGGNSFNWSNSAVSQNISNVVANTYSVTVTDNKGCSATTSTTITEPTAISASTAVTNPTCNGSSNGSIALTVSGGAGSYSYNWSNSSSSQNISSLNAGTFTVTITDGNGCTTTTSATVTQPAVVVVNETHNNIGCNGSNSGVINTTVSGGTGAYTYVWSNGATTSNISNLSVGSYTVTVKDANNCSATNSANITQPAALTVTQTHVDVLCNGSSTGSITLTVTGGTGPHSFVWNDGATSQNRTNIAAGSYSVTVTDANHCAANAAATLTQPTAVVASTTKTDVVCNGASTGSIDLTVSGGTGTYTYQWNNFQFIQDISGVPAGNYTVTITDGNGCNKVVATTISQPAPIAIGVNVTNVTCYGAANGAITTTISGGNGGFSYLWNNGAATQNLSTLVAGNYILTVTDMMGCNANLNLNVSQPSPIVLTQTHTNVSCNGTNTGAIDLSASGGAGVYNYVWSNGATTQDINSLAAGTYTVSATDGSSCSVSLSVVLSQPTAMSLSTTVVDAICNGSNTGAVNLTVTGGGTPYQYLWSNAAVTQNLSNVASGTYSVVVTDANSCTAGTSATVNQSGAISVSLSKTDASCFGGANGSILTNVSGGSGSYTYNWNNSATTGTINNLSSGTYTVTVHDASNCSAVASATVSAPTQIQISETHTNVGCNGGSNATINATVNGGVAPYNYTWNTGSSNNSINSLNAGSYTLLVTDANTCTVITSVIITEPTAIALSETHTPYACSNSAGSIQLSVNGGTAPYNYNWNSGSTTQNQTNLVAGAYQVTVSDANNCSATIATSIAALPALSTSLTKTDITCFGVASGAIDLTVTGGSSPYTYNWTNGATSQDPSGLAAGVYTVTVSDAKNCNATLSATIVQPAQISVNHTATGIACFGGSNGAINVTVNGGVGPYTYLWNNSSTGNSINNLNTGSYAVTVTDANNCTTVKNNMLVTEPTQLTATAAVTNVGCSSNNDGEINVTPAGGTPPYHFNWSNLATSARIINLTVGNYDVTVTDNNGCSTTKQNTVGLTAPIQIASSVANTSCPQVQNGAIDLSISGGTPGFTFNWNNGETTEDIDHLSQGNYNVVVTDTRNCTAAASFNITYDYVLSVQASPSTEINLGEEVQLTATANVDHSNVYSWTPALNTMCSNCASTKAVPTHDTHYTVTVVDANGCSASDTTSVSVNSITDVFIPNAFTPNNDGNNDVYQLEGDLNTIEYLDFKIFNRWGELVYESMDHNFHWDGTYKGQPVDRGVYIYTMKVVFINGYKRDYKGSITVLK